MNLYLHLKNQVMKIEDSEACASEASDEDLPIEEKMTKDLNISDIEEENN